MAGPYRIHARHLVPGHPRGSVVVVHGMVVAGRGTVPLAAALQDRGLSVHLPDLPGFGESDKPARALDVDGLAVTLGRWMEAAGIGHAAVLGNSFGTQVAAALAAGASDSLSSLVLVAPTIDSRFRRAWARRLPSGRPGGPPRRSGLGRLQQLLVERLVSRPVGEGRSALRRLIAEEYLAAGPARAASTYRHALRDDLMARMPHIPVPVLVVRGRGDSLASAPWARSLAAAAPAGRCVEIPEVGHDAQFLRPDAVAAAVADMLAHGPADQDTSTG